MAGRNVWGTKRNRWGAQSSEGGSVAVVDNLNSTSATDALSAKQGKVLNDGKFGKVSCTYAVDEASQLSTKTHGAGYTCLCKGDGKIYTSDGSAWNGGVLGTLGVLYIAESETYVYDTNKFVLISTDNAITLNGHNENYFAKESEAAKKSGSYPNMSVGSASNLNGVDTVNATYLRRTSVGSADIGSGVAQIRSLKGNSYVWNQGVSRDFQPATSNGVTATNNISENCVEFSGVITGNATAFTTFIGFSEAVIGHKYYGKTKITSNPNNLSFRPRLFDNHTFTESNQSSESSLIFVKDNLKRNSGVALATIGDDFTGVKIKYTLIDLTLMFGAGNEPATVEAFESWCAAQGIDLDKYYPYNDGEVINCKADAIKTDGFNQYDHSAGKANVIKGNVYQITGTYTSLTLGGATITPDASGYFTPTIGGELTVTGGDATDTCIHLKWSGKKDGEFETYWAENHNLNLTSITGKVNGQGTSETIFPDGLVKVGNVADEIIVDSDGKARRAIKRFGKVDLGTLSWSYRDFETHGAVFYVRFEMKSYYGYNDNIKVGKYSTFLNGNTQISSSFKNSDNIVSNVSGFVGPGITSINIKDSSYTDAATFKAAMSGVYLYYELGTPVNYTLDTPLNMTYRVDDFGTETAMVLSSGSLVDADITKTAPLNYDVRYALNVVDTVRNLNRNYLGMTGTQNTFAAISSAIAEYGMTMTLGAYDTTNEYYPVTISGGWKPASAAPASASATGTKGMYYIDTDYFYVCVDTNTWKRFALSTW